MKIAPLFYGMELESKKLYVMEIKATDNTHS